MSVEFIGFIGTRSGSEIHPPSGPIVDLDYIAALARAHDAGGFDRALIAFHATSPEAILIGQYAASVTEAVGSHDRASAGLHRSHRGGAAIRDPRPDHRRPRSASTSSRGATTPS